MYVSGVVDESVVDGEGIRTTIFISGCRHNCYGCHNPLTHNFKYGKEFTENKQNEVINKISRNPLIDGITLSGGDSMFSPRDTISFAQKLRMKCPHLTIWIYTGFTYNQIISNTERLELLAQCDVLVDGQYIESKKDLSLKFRGSTNQRIIDIQKSLKCGTVVLYKL